MILILLVRDFLWYLFLKNLTTSLIFSKDGRFLDQIRSSFLLRLNVVVVKDCLLDDKFHIVLMLLTLLARNWRMLWRATATTIDRRVPSIEVVSSYWHVCHALWNLGWRPSLVLLHFMNKCLLDLLSFLDICNESYSVYHCIKRCLWIWRSPRSDQLLDRDQLLVELLHSRILSIQRNTCDWGSLLNWCKYVFRRLCSLQKGLRHSIWMNWRCMFNKRISSSSLLLRRHWTNLSDRIHLLS